MPHQPFFGSICNRALHGPGDEQIGRLLEMVRPEQRAELYIRTLYGLSCNQRVPINDIVAMVEAAPTPDRHPYHTIIVHEARGRVAVEVQEYLFLNQRDAEETHYVTGCLDSAAARAAGLSSTPERLEKGKSCLPGVVEELIDTGHLPLTGVADPAYQPLVERELLALISAGEQDEAYRKDLAASLQPLKDPLLIEAANAPVLRMLAKIARAYHASIWNAALTQTVSDMRQSVFELDRKSVHPTDHRLTWDIFAENVKAEIARGEKDELDQKTLTARAKNYLASPMARRAGLSAGNDRDVAEACVALPIVEYYLAECGVLPRQGTDDPKYDKGLHKEMSAWIVDSRRNRTKAAPALLPVDVSPVPLSAAPAQTALLLITAQPEFPLLEDAQASLRRLYVAIPEAERVAVYRQALRDTCESLGHDELGGTVILQHPHDYLPVAEELRLRSHAAVSAHLAARAPTESEGDDTLLSAPDPTLMPPGKCLPLLIERGARRFDLEAS